MTRKSYSLRQESMAPWAWLLTYVLLVQAMVPVQAHTKWSTDADGRLILICSWDGSRRLATVPESDQPLESADHTNPAVAFSLLLITAIAETSTAAPNLAYYPDVWNRAPRVIYPKRQLTQLSNIRAPPALQLSIA